MALRKISDQSLVGQLATMSGMVAAISVGALAAADLYIDQKYATDQDVQVLHLALEDQFQELSNAVDNNTASTKRAISSVDGLTLVVLDIQIGDLAAAVRELEELERENGIGWTRIAAEALAEKRRRLADLNQQREVLYRRVMSR